ncbi:TPA: hypothetical protein ACIV0P_003690, partial [Salmonella enterica subsp. diarizonae serovar 61:z52-z57:-]
FCEGGLYKALYSIALKTLPEIIALTLIHFIAGFYSVTEGNHPVFRLYTFVHGRDKTTTPAHAGF